MINHEIHRINLAMAQADYLNISGQRTWEAQVSTEKTSLSDQ